jgi:hypothetical protein
MNSMNTNRQTSVTKENNKEKEMKATKITGSNVIRWTGLAAIVGGIIFAGIQPIHPADVVASVNTTAWGIITPIKTAMCLFFLISIAGLYARQVNKAGWLGLAGFLIFSTSWALQTAYVFAEAFILPVLSTTAPKFVDGVLGISYGRASEVDLGALPTIYSLGVGGFYMLGGLVFGIAIFRAGVLPRWAGGLLAATAALTPLAAFFPHNIQRLAGMPMGLALACLGYALWTERREKVSEFVPGTGTVSPQLSQGAAD